MPNNADLTAQIDNIEWRENTEGMSGTIRLFVGYNKIYAADSGLPKKGISKFSEFLTYRFPGSDKMVCRELRYAELTGAKGSRDVEMCSVTAEFSTAPWLDGSIKEEWQPSLDIREVGSGRVWTSDGASVCQPLTIAIPNARWRISKVFGWNRQLEDKLSEVVGCVNSDWWQYKAPGTVLCECPDMDKYYDYEYKMYFARVTFNMLWRAVPWNYEYRTDTGEWDSTLPVLHNSYAFAGLGIF